MTILQTLGLAAKDTSGSALASRKTGADTTLDAALRAATDAHTATVDVIRTDAKTEFDSIRATLDSAARRAADLQSVATLLDDAAGNRLADIAYDAKALATLD